jgi:structure-specific recognition protein 1
MSFRIDRADFDSLYNFLSGKKIRIINTQDALQESATANAIQEMEVEDDDSEDDEDFGSDDGSGASSESGSDSDDSNSVEMVPEEDDSDLEEMRKKRKKSDESPTSKKSKGKASPKKKKKKDPNAPKRGLNSYMFFSKEMRPKIMEENPGLGMGEVGKLLGQKYKDLTDEEKAKYEKMAAADKTRYEEEMETYEKPEDSGDEDESIASGKKKKKKAKKDPNAPKNALTAFMFFNKDMRHKLKEENPDLSFGDLGRLVGEKFKALTDEEKAKYNKMSEDDKERYAKEKDAYDAKKKTEAEAAAASDIDSDSDSD